MNNQTSYAQAMQARREAIAKVYHAAYGSIAYFEGITELASAKAQLQSMKKELEAQNG